MIKLFGGLLLGVGILLMTGSGICSLAVLGMGLSQGGSVATASSLGLVLLFGGIPFAMGFGLFRLGLWLLKPPPPPAVEPSEPQP
jgi:hypothetical protein